MRPHSFTAVAVLALAACASRVTPVGPAPAQLAIVSATYSPATRLVSYQFSLPAAGYLTLLELREGSIQSLRLLGYDDALVPAGRAVFRTRDPWFDVRRCDRCVASNPSVMFGANPPRPVSDPFFRPGVQTTGQVVQLDERSAWIPPTRSAPVRLVLIASPEPLAGAELVDALDGVGPIESPAALMAILRPRFGSLLWASFPSR